MDRRKLNSKYYLVVEDISFASTAIGDATNGRSATTAWAAQDEVTYKGTLAEILIFAMMAFDINGTQVLEKYRIVDERSYKGVKNLAEGDVPTIIDLDVLGAENIIVTDDITFLTNLTDNFRESENEAKHVVLEKKDASGTSYYQATIKELLAYLFKWEDGGTAQLYTLLNVGLLDVSSGVNMGVSYPNLSDSTLGPVEFATGRVTLASQILGA